MDTKVGRFFEFIKKDKTRNFLAFALYFLFIINMVVDLPLILEFIWLISITLVIMLRRIIYSIDSFDKISDQREEKISNKIKREAKKIAIEIVMFIPVFLTSILIISLFMVDEPANQSSIKASFNQAPLLNSIYMIIIGPIIEEYIFRFLPYQFIKNKILYIIVSTVVFAAMHVVSDANPFCHIWFYMIRPLYYAYRYQKTEDIWVTISMHSLNNFIVTLSMIVSYFQ